MSSSLTAEPLNDQQVNLHQNNDDTERTLDSPEPNNNIKEKESNPMSVAPTSGKPCMQLKGSLVPMTVLELNYFEIEQFISDIRAKTSQAPDFFDNLPVVIGLEKFEDNGTLPFKQLIEACLEQSIRVVAVRGGSELLQSAAKQAGLGILPKQKERGNSDSQNFVDSAAAPIAETPATAARTDEGASAEEQPEIAQEEVIKKVVQKERQVSKVVHQPIRSGQQVYAQDGDLIVLSSVSAGAEILADGNIHVYGTLRGRALAGVKGDTTARIFCQSLAAELVSIAGQYKISEDIDRSALGKAAQVYLDKDALRFKELAL
jgi:septum site-determining protein MinC